MNHIYRVEVKLEGVIQILADSEEAARSEAQNVAEKTKQFSADKALYLQTTGVVIRRVLKRGEGL